jgi:riboflavin biosynthesis pyrimidine reductase
MVTVSADRDGRVDLKKLFKRLAAKGISSVMIEGGAQIITSVLKRNLANRLVTVIAPKIIGCGIEAVGDLNIRHLDLAMKITVKKISVRGHDIIVDGRLM